MLGIDLGGAPGDSWSSWSQLPFRLLALAGVLSVGQLIERFAHLVATRSQRRAERRSRAHGAARARDRLHRP